MEKSFVFILIILFQMNFCKVSPQSDEILDLIKSDGYDGESHEVETEDGYLLKVHRVLPQGQTNLKLPVLLMHGLFATSADYLLTGVKTSLAYLLADNGYDVWMGNARGNKYSTKHKTFSTESGEFWNFGWHEIGFYDLPATIDHLLNVSKASKVFCVGHSQGSTSLLVLLSTRPKFNQKIIEAHLMAPAAYMKNFDVTLSQFLFPEISRGLLDDYSYLNFENYWDVAREFSKLFCNKKLTKLCEETYYATYGRNKHGIKVNNRVLEFSLNYLSPRISVNQLKHFNQLITTGEFRWFDYGSVNNLKHYNSKSPPKYQLKNITTSIHLYAGDEDSVISKIDVAHLRDTLSSVVKNYEVIPSYNHGDFVYANNLRKALYKTILKSFELVNN